MAKQVEVMVDESVYNAFAQYAIKSGATVSYLIREALTEWVDTVIAARSESLDAANSKVVCINRNIAESMDIDLAALQVDTRHPA